MKSYWILTIKEESSFNKIQFFQSLEIDLLFVKLGLKKIKIWKQIFNTKICETSVIFKEIVNEYSKSYM